MATEKQVAAVKNAGQGSESKAAQKPRKRRVSKADIITINVKESKNAAGIVRLMSKKQGWKESTNLQEDCNANIFWYERAVPASEVRLLNENQKINMFPGMHDMVKKVVLARCLNRMRKLYANDYCFYPTTWTLPNAYEDFKKHCEKQRRMPTYIVKPSAGCQGVGIYLIQNIDQLHNPQANVVIQEYISRPLLVDGLKFDLRLYVLVLSMDPMCLYLYRDGMARFATQAYEEPSPDNLETQFMHLTNYSINKLNPDYVFATENGEDSSKRSFSEVLEQLLSDDVIGESDVDGMWRSISDIVIKTMLAVQPQLANIYWSCAPEGAEDRGNSCCFQILGFDVMLDADLRPWLIEVNHNPSLTCDTPFDTILKGGVVSAAMQLLHIQPFDKSAYKDQTIIHMQQKETSAASTPLEKERLQQEQLKFRRARASSLASSSSRERRKSDQGAEATKTPRTNGNGKTPKPPKRHNVITDTPEELDKFMRIYPTSSGGYDHILLFNDETLNKMWRHCCGCRSNKLSASRFGKFARECGLIDDRLSQPEVDLLFIQMMQQSPHADENSGVNNMTYSDFCDTLLEIAMRKHPDSVSKTQALVKLLKEVELAPPPESAAAAQRPSGWDKARKFKDSAEDSALGKGDVPSSNKGDSDDKGDSSPDDE